MLTKWHLQNFKAFGPPVDLALAPLTLFMGANSSGKSTILQSILLIKQTLQYTDVGKPLALNGPLLRLGDFADVVSDTATERRISLGWTLNFDNSDAATDLDSSSAEFLGAYSPFGIHEVSTRLQFAAADSSISQQQSAVEVSLAEAEFQTGYSDGDQQQQFFNVSIQYAPATSADQLTLLPTVRSGIRRNPDQRFYRVREISSEAQHELLDERPNGVITGAQLSNFFPSQYLIQYDENEKRIQSIISYLLGNTPSFRLLPAYRNYELPATLVKSVADWLERQFESNPRLRAYRPQYEPPLATNVRELSQQISRAMRAIRTTRATSNPQPATGDIQELQTIIESGLRTQVTKASYAFDSDSVSVANYARDLAKNYFSSRVRYLGPLRDDPRPLYPIEGVAAVDDVGYRGEHTAAVLDANNYRTIEYVPSAELFNEAPVRTTTLQQAVIDWLVYLGVADGVSTLDRGKLGHELKVKSVPNGRSHDLTNVGVGVSQVLPIVVMALVAQRGSTLIFEQPELHLHPKVQTRLADFFISMSLLGKQCLLETHSEYLVHRLRLRIAQDATDKMAELVRLYFIEKRGSDALCRDVKINTFGTIIEWPKDFFDQSQEEIEQILKAASNKSRKLRDKLNSVDERGR